MRLLCRNLKIRVNRFAVYTMKLFLVALALAFCFLGAAGNDCQTDEETNYAKKFVKDICPKLTASDEQTGKACYMKNGVDVDKFATGCKHACDPSPEQEAIDQECCFIKNMVANGVTISKKEAADANCLK